MSNPKRVRLSPESTTSFSELPFDTIAHLIRFASIDTLLALRLVSKSFLQLVSYQRFSETPHISQLQAHLQIVRSASETDFSPDILQSCVDLGTRLLFHQKTFHHIRNAHDDIARWLNSEDRFTDEQRSQITAFLTENDGVGNIAFLEEVDTRGVELDCWNGPSWSRSISFRLGLKLHFRYEEVHQGEEMEYHLYGWPSEASWKAGRPREQLFGMSIGYGNVHYDEWSAFDCAQQGGGGGGEAERDGGRRGRGQQQPKQRRRRKRRGGGRMSVEGAMATFSLSDEEEEFFGPVEMMTLVWVILDRFRDTDYLSGFGEVFAVPGLPGEFSEQDESVEEEENSGRRRRGKKKKKRKKKRKQRRTVAAGSRIEIMRRTLAGSS